MLHKMCFYLTKALVKLAKGSLALVEGVSGFSALAVTNL